MATSPIAKGNMQVNRNDLTPELASKLESMPLEELEQLLGVQPAGKQASSTEPSKWAKIVARNKKNPISLGNYTETDRQHRKDFRENFQFKHDQE